MPKVVKKTLAVFCLLFLGAHLSIFLQQAQAQEEFEAATYHLDSRTVEKGYPISFDDRKFTLLVQPYALSGAGDIALSSASSTAAISAYKFSITRESESEPVLLKRPLSAVFSTKQESPYQYFRMYYYHRPQGIWLALAASFDSKRQLIVSNKIDFAQGVIGIMGANVPLPDRVPEMRSSIKNAEGREEDEFFTIALGSDIMEKGYTIFWNGIQVAVPPHTLQAPSEATFRWNEKEELLDYNFKPIFGNDPPFAGGTFIILRLPLQGEGIEVKKITFWDNTVSLWRDLPSSYDYDKRYVTAKSPFHFGRYKVVSKQDAYVGEASWFRDSLITKTKMAAASNEFAYGARVVVTNLKNGKQVGVEVRSTGPYVEGRIIDLTYSAFAQIANPKMGVATVRVDRVK